MAEASERFLVANSDIKFYYPLMLGTVDFMGSPHRVNFMDILRKRGAESSHIMGWMSGTKCSCHQMAIWLYHCIFINLPCPIL